MVKLALVMPCLPLREEIVMIEQLKDKYQVHYSESYLKKAGGKHCYPVEFVVRTFLGSSYPELKIDRNFCGKKILDLGCGDGRNIPMLFNCGMEVFGVEIAQEICSSVMERMQSVFGISCDIRQGTNAHIPFEEGAFDYVLACHSIYYVEEGTSFLDNIGELARVTKKNGYVVLSLPDPQGTILKNAMIDGGYYRITADPLGLRNGSLFRVFGSEDEIQKEFSAFFKEFSIGHCFENYYGFVQSMWIVCAMKR
jgi:SAM-dependent methyltransferase